MVARALVLLLLLLVVVLGLGVVMDSGCRSSRRHVVAGPRLRVREGSGR